MVTLDKKFYINIGQNGPFKASGNSTYDTTVEDVDKLFASLKQDGNRKILLYFHGGLVNAENGMGTAERITRYITTGTTSHPISFVWETGLIETVQQNFDTIGNSSFFKKLLVKIIKVAGRNLGVDISNDLVQSKGIGNMSDEEINMQLQRKAPFDEINEVQGKRAISLTKVPPEIQTDAYYEINVRPEVQSQLEEEIYNDPQLISLSQSEKTPAEAALIKNDIAETIPEGEKGVISLAALIKAAVKITISVIKRYLKKRNHDFYPTVVEEILREIYIADIGSWVWGRMKEKAKKMWTLDTFSGDQQNWHAGSYFLKKLDEYQNENGKLTLDLVGHSAGAIVICELVDKIAQRNLKFKFRNIIFMAPACTCELFSGTILKHKELFENFRIFTMLDEYEKKDHLVPIIYPRSLLYFISGVLEDNSYDAYVLGLQRHIVGNSPYDSENILNDICQFLKKENYIVYSVTQQGTAQGLISGSQHHGDFDNEHETTLDSIVYLVK